MLEKSKSLFYSAAVLFGHLSYSVRFRLITRASLMLRYKIRFLKIYKIPILGIIAITAFIRDIYKQIKNKFN